jgi:hypothetical protein
MVLILAGAEPILPNPLHVPAIPADEAPPPVLTPVPRFELAWEPSPPIENKDRPRRVDVAHGLTVRRGRDGLTGCPVSQAEATQLLFGDAHQQGS